jgi:hypothetical protein
MAVADSDVVIKKSDGRAVYKVGSNQDARLANAFPVWANTVSFTYSSGDSIYATVYDQLKIMYPDSSDA